jgi:RNA polymerase sigma factor (sigma-70 family)
VTFALSLSDALVRFDGWRPEDEAATFAHIELAQHWHAAQLGDERAFAALVLALSAPLDAYARRLTGSAELAADLVQDVFVRLWTQRDSTRVHGNIRGYLYRSLRNRALDVRKHDQAEDARLHLIGSGGELPGMAAQPAAADVLMDRQEIEARVAAAFATLSPRGRETALLRWRDELGRDEIAAIMGVSVRTVNTQLTLAARVVRALLADLRDPQ